MHQLEIKLIDGSIYYLEDIFLVDVMSELTKEGRFIWTESNSSYQKTFVIFKEHIIKMEETFFKGESI